MKTKLNVLLQIVFACFLMTKATAQTVHLKIIETTDAHGAIFPYDFINGRKMQGSLAQVYDYVEKQRRKPNQEVLLLSGGDILQGQPTVYYYNFEKPDAFHLYARVMNFMGYDAGAVGNHDIEPGHSVYDKFAKELNFPWLAANAIDVNTGKPYFPPYAIFEKGGVKIAVLGMVTPGIPNWLPSKIWRDIEFVDMVETAEKWATIIRREEQPDLLFGLFHSGVDYTFGGAGATTPRNENAAQLVAEQVPGFDIIFCGHDHRIWNRTVLNKDSREVLLLGAGPHAQNVAVATLKMNFDEKSGRWQKEISTEIVNVQNRKPHKKFMQKFAVEFDEVESYVSRKIGFFTKTTTSRDALFGGSSFVDLIHKVQLELTGADISISAPLKYDASIDSGLVTVSDLFKLYKYENLLYTMELTGLEIRDYLEFSYLNWFNQMSGPDDHLLNFSQNDSGDLNLKNGKPKLAEPVYSFDSMAGLSYLVDVSKAKGDRIQIMSMANDDIFDFDKKYTVAINSYRGNGGGNHLIRGAGIPKEELSKRIISSTKKDLRFLLMRWIEEQENVTPSALGNWQVIPGEWWEKASQTDRQLLFGN